MMKKLIPSKYRYPMFFTGVMVIVISGLLNKYLHMAEGYTEIGAAIGFLLFMFSIVL